MKVYGAIEAGGTKFVCIIAADPQNILAEAIIQTTTPEETLEQTLAFFEENRQSYDLCGLGIGSFGPLDLDTQSETFGYITSTPKPGWAGTDILGMMSKGLELPVALDTDVNAAAIGEGKWGAAVGVDTFLYFTIGTGIGGGGIVNGRPLHGLIHPEMGHIRIPHDHAADPYPGHCPFHGDCFEGLASGEAIRDRWGKRAEELEESHPAWALEAHYIALALCDAICVISPRRIILGGGVMNQIHLFQMIQRNVVELLGGYVQSPEILENIARFIVPPSLGRRAGVLGALALAQNLG